MFLAGALYMSTPMLAALVMMLIVTKGRFLGGGLEDARPSSSWIEGLMDRSLVPLLVATGATALVWATPLASLSAAHRTAEIVVGAG